MRSALMLTPMTNSSRLFPVMISERRYEKQTINKVFFYNSLLGLSKNVPSV
jgi:hypothetical protein